MTETPTKGKVSPAELLEIRERSWRPRAEASSLAAETFDDIPSHRREQALVAFGRLSTKLGPGAARERLFRRYPAVQVLATAGVAADHYQRGTFWPKLTAIMQITPDPEFQRDWGEAFLDSLRRLGLPTFEKEGDAGTRYVGRILIHSGMPTYCLGDFFRTLAWKRTTTPGLTPEEFVSWAAAKAAGVGFANVDMPVQRFLRYGDEFAVDVTDRSIELLDAVATGSSADDVLLPERFWNEAQRLFDQHGIDASAPIGSITSAGIDIRPRLVLDPFGQGLLLRLPPVGDAPDGQAVWVVTLDEDIQRVATESLWPGSLEPAPQTDVPLSRPVRSASVALAGREHLQLQLSILDDTDPMLAFGEDGELIGRGLPLPAGKVWVLFPGDPSLLRSIGAFRVIVESPLPPRWSGFCLAQVDLSEAASISIHGSTRTVRKFEAARIDGVVPLRGVRTTSGLPVVAQLPHVTLPNAMPNAAWDVTLHDGAGAMIARHRVVGEEDPNRLWESVPRPLIGTFTIRVRGPWGRGASRAFTIVEGLTASFTPGWRRFVSGGLQPCVVHLNAADGVNLSRAEVHFDERKREHAVRAVAGLEFRSLVITPPHMTVAYQSDNTIFSPSVRPLALIREDVRDCPGELILDIGASAEPTLHVIVNGRPVQTVASHSSRAGIYRFNLGEIVDTLRDFAQATLALSSDGELVIATLRPRTLFTGVELDGDALVLADCVDVEGLTAYLFATRAPWREPACVPVVEGRVTLPPWLVHAGPIRVMARIEDPWVPLPTPSWPEAGKSRLADNDGWVDDGDAEETAISMFLAGDTSQSVEVIDFVRLWTARALLPALSLGDRITEIADAIDTEVYGNPAAALAALTGSEAPSEMIAALMVRTGLAWADLADAHRNVVPPWTKRGALPAALLSAADSVWSDEEIDAAVTVCGDAVHGILDGRDPFAGAGRMDESADLLDHNPALREQFIQAARLVPQGLLSADSRVLAAMDLVAQRHDPRLQWLVRNARSVMKEGERLVRMIGDEATQGAFDARRYGTRDDGWRALPSVSIVFALAARHASRGHVEAKRWIQRERRPWESLAEVAPELVTIDLIIAELTVGRRALEVEVSND
ncbi:hypothetical protein EUA04_11685 [Mycolicibacterium obuense]|uniref:Uncharacterized protein n=1 Tax=Mycolicibacterium obuense TaxID=1807 RepID=A0A4R5XAM7_9MYCO|nr:hypothetical protein [Mycolicibacterium obuense]TDL10537.1 hypothetical protein EUA04_11685 [Mycolicibacterium obuense]